VVGFLANRGSGLGIRLSVQTTGCSGLGYNMEFVDNAMEKLDCKRLATAAFSFSIWIVKFKAFIQPFFNKIHFGTI
jgi:Fe-S cluster assembly iron-binding protein IscA